MNDALFAPIPNYRERESQQADWISNKTLWRIKAESEKVVLAPRKSRSDGMKPSDFDKCEIYMYKLQNHTRQQPIYNKKIGFEHYLFITL